MSELNVWITLALLTLATLITRSTLLVLGERVKLPLLLERALRYAPACALAAIVAPELLVVHQQVQFDWYNARLMAAVAATLCFVVTRSLLATLVLGMTVFTALRLWLA